jgi:hypothetical protein
MIKPTTRATITKAGTELIDLTLFTIKHTIAAFPSFHLRENRQLAEKTGFRAVFSNHLPKSNEFRNNRVSRVTKPKLVSKASGF